MGVYTRGQGDLFGKPERPASRKLAWTELDRIRRSIRSLEARIEATGGTEDDLLALGIAQTRLVRAEEEARVKWKKCFKS